VGGVTVVTAVPLPFLSCGSSSSGPPTPRFFTDAERSALGALANAIIPPDDTPGGKDLGAVQYIETLLTAFDNADANHPPVIFAGGPFSGRAPYADDQGQPSKNFPPNSFSTFLALDRVKDAGFRLQIFGSSGLPGGAPNEKILGPVVGLRDQLRTGLATAIGGANPPLEQMTQDELIAYVNTFKSEFLQLLISLVSQGCFCPPEYGGNLGLAGWKLAHFEGDQQPLGYSVWSTALGKYVERPDAPMTTPTVTDPEPLDAEVISLIDDVVALLGGKAFMP